MQHHETRAADRRSPRPRRLAVRRRGQALSRRHQLLVDQPVRPRQPRASARRWSTSSTSCDHVMLAGFTHAPVVELSERLSALTGARPRLLRQRRRLGHRDRAEDELPPLAQRRPAGQEAIRRLQGGYHGETVGALGVTDIALFRDAYAPLVRAARHGAVARCARRAGRRIGARCRAPRRRATLETLLAERARRRPPPSSSSRWCSAPPAWRCTTRRTCARRARCATAIERAPDRRRDRGRLRAHRHASSLSEQAGIRPDFICLSKGLTGGYLPLSLVLTTDAVYDAFYDDDVSARLPAFALVHRQSARLPRRAGDARRSSARTCCESTANAPSA